jgi:hypothetical protein
MTDREREYQRCPGRRRDAPGQSLKSQRRPGKPGFPFLAPKPFGEAELRRAIVRTLESEPAATNLEPAEPDFTITSDKPLARRLQANA